jgi:hypothetical protein
MQSTHRLKTSPSELKIRKFHPTASTSLLILDTIGLSIMIGVILSFPLLIKIHIDKGRYSKQWSTSEVFAIFEPDSQLKSKDPE